MLRILNTMFNYQRSVRRLLYRVINLLNLLHVNIVDGTGHEKVVIRMKYFHLLFRSAVDFLVLTTRNKRNIDHGKISIIKRTFHSEFTHVTRVNTSSWLLIVIKDREGCFICTKVNLFNWCILIRELSSLVLIDSTICWNFKRSYLRIKYDWYTFCINDAQVKFQRVVTEPVFLVHLAPVLHNLVTYDVRVTELNHCSQLHAKECQD